MDPMRNVASAAVRKNLGPDPSMGRKVELLRRLVSMREERKMPRGRNPKATINPPSRSRGVPTRLPKPARFSDMPGYNFGPPRGM